MIESGQVLFGAVRELTAFDSTALPGTGTSLAVAGIGGTGVRSLVEAIGIVAPEVGIAPIGPIRRPDDAAVGIALVVLDPSSSVGEEEKRLVYDLRSRFGIVALVCNKIDAFWDWPRIVRAHRALLDPHEQLPVFAVSAVAALAGAVDESGVGALVEWIREMLAAPGDLRAERVRATAAIGAVEYHLEQLRRRAIGRSPAEDVEELTRRRRALVESRDRGRVDRLASVRAGLARVRTESAGATQNGIRTMSADASARCAQLTSRTVDAYVADLAAEGAELATRIEQAARDGIDEVAATALIGADAADDDAAHADIASDDAGAPADDDPDAVESLLPAAMSGAAVPFHRAVPTGRRGAEDALVVLIGASTGVGIGRLIVAPMAAVHTLQWVSMPLTLILGVGVAAWVIRVRRAAALRGEMRGWTNDALAEIRTRIDQRVGMLIGAAEPRLTGQLQRFHERRTRSLSTQIADIDDRIRSARSGPKSTEEGESAARARDLHEALDRRARTLMGEDLMGDDEVLADPFAEDANQDQHDSTEQGNPDHT